MRKGIDCKGREWEELALSEIKNDITSVRYGSLVALFPVRNSNKKRWLCKCDCGNETVVDYGQLNAKKVISCGCSRIGSRERFLDKKNKNTDFRGVKYGRLTIVDYLGFENGKSTFLFRCDCGNEIKLPLSRVKSGNTSSCGCLSHDMAVERWGRYRENSDVIGKTFGRLTVVKFLRVENEEAIYLFKCNCGNDVELPLKRVKYGNTNSCGCLWDEWNDSYKENIIGKRFGKLLVKSCVGTDKHNSTIFKCSCDCGSETIVARYSLVSGHTQSCGCICSVGESNIKKIFNDANVKYKSQYSFSDLTTDTGHYLFYDFGILDDCGKLQRLIEFDGLQHIRPYDYFGGEDRFAQQQKYDSIKNQYALSHNIPLVRIPYYKRDSMSLNDLLGPKYLVKGDGVLYVTTTNSYCVSN